MFALDFEYDGQYLSDYNFIICDFDSSNGTKTVDAGSKITFEKVSRNGGRIHTLVKAKYDECIKSSFAICKNPDLCQTYEERYITNDEYRDLVRWLNRREFLRFRLLSDEYTDTCYFNASFNVETITIADRLVGLQLSMETDKPFGYGEKETRKLVFTQNVTQKKIVDVSDEIGYIYPDVVIKVTIPSGTITINNVEQDSHLSINGCTENEIITIQGEEKIISTSMNAHDIYNDFNYDFLKIGNTLTNNVNTITSDSGGCEVTISYYPIVKNIPY